jgi:hypothetical protein
MLPWRYRAPKLLTFAADLTLARLVAACYCCLVTSNCNNVHTARSSHLSDVHNTGILSHRNISCRVSELAPYFRTMNMPWQSVVRPACVTLPFICIGTTSWSDQVKIATLLFPTLFYNEELALTSNSLLISLQLVIWFAAKIFPEVSKTNFAASVTGVLQG